MSNTFWVIHATRPYGVTTCRERELTLDHIHTFLTKEGRGRPPQMRDQLNVVVTSETTWTWKTIHIIHSNKANMKGWLWQPNDIRGPCGRKFPNISLTGEEKPRETSTRKLVSIGYRTRTRCVKGAHATVCSTAVDTFSYYFLQFFYFYTVYSTP